MEEEVEVDIEGDAFDSSVSELDGGVLLQDQFVQSAWKTSSGILPWELDSSISAENREVIEKMLLEEQYYLTGKAIPEHIWHSDAPSKQMARKSPAKASSSAPGSSSRWSKQEKELFEEGLAQFGRRWTKIAKLVGSRSVLQVKSYARQYFKHQVRPEPRATAPSAGQVLHVQPPPSSSSHAPSLVNAVRIEKLSDDEDEEVDITDDLSDDGGGTRQDELKTEASSPGQLMESDSSRHTHVEPVKEEPDLWGTEIQPEPSIGSPSPQSQTQPSSAPALLLCETQQVKPIKASLPPANHETQTVLKERTGEEHIHQGQNSHTEHRYHLEDACRDTADSGDTIQPRLHPRSEEDQDEEDEEEGEVEELNVPEQEIQMDMKAITEEEKQAIPEFFEGRPSKTPERYLKIRNYILDQWLKSKPKYLNKTSVRPGLKNCGDVNCIGRIHTYLELIGAINFSCEQAVYNRPKVLDRSKHKEGKDVLEAYQLAQRLQSMRTRKRRVRDIWGNWCDAKDLEGQTYEHLSAEELAQRREEMKKQPKPFKRLKGSFDPFQLIPCKSFGEEAQEPFQVVVYAEALLIMDMHAHVSWGEVIGLLGGTFNEEDKILKICAAEPCNSVSTGLQCEMDPLSQTQACDCLSALGLSVVGWYHSHPSFHPNPSVRDIHTQDQFQSYFSRGGAPFIGMIVSPYDPANPSPHSQTTCLLVNEIQESGPQKLPYKFDFLISPDIPDWEQTSRRAEWIVHKYSQSHGSVQMDRFFRRDSHLTCLEKMMSSLAKYLEALPAEEGHSFLTQIQDLFLSDFIPQQQQQQQASDQEEGEGLDSSSKPDEPPLNHPVSEARAQAEDSDQGSVKNRSSPQTTTREEDMSPVLHMGSVLLTGHDYLL